MSRAFAVGIVLFACLSAPRLATSGGWSVGSGFGVGSIQGVGSGGNTTVLSIPNSALGYQPGLRIGYGNQARTRELVIDSGVFLVDEAGTTLSLMVAEAGYQHVFSSTAFFAPFADVGVGILNENGSGRSATTATYGGGVGVRHVVRDQHGAFRAELRFDVLDRNDDIGRPRLKTTGFRVGFDLWL